MDIVVLGDPKDWNPGPGRGLGTLHAASPAALDPSLPGPLTFCRKPTGWMDVLGPRTVEQGSTDWYPPEVADQAARCTTCGLHMYLNE